MMILFFLLSATGLIADRWTKWLALGGVSRDFGFVHFSLVKNPALVFSWPSPNWLAMFLMTAAIGVGVAVGVSAWRQKNFWAAAGILLMLLGALSNGYDRLLYGYVIDWGYLGPWWPIFNIADLMIAAGIVVTLASWRNVRTRT